MSWDVRNRVMRFIGSKITLLDNINKIIVENTTGNEQIFCDIFSGTGSVAQHFKSKYEVYSNDSLYFSYVIQKAIIENNSIPAFEKLKRIGIQDPFSFLEETPVQIKNYNEDQFFIMKNYSPNNCCDRMYISNKNAIRADFIRMTIEEWKAKDLITKSEYYYLLASLIEAIPSVSNITGTYGAYLKQWDKRAFKDLELSRLKVIDNGRNNRCYNLDANKLIEEIEGDILYIDPPYNSRQYASNYHLLETIARYDYPEIYGITGMRPYEDLKSSYCIRNEVEEVFEDLIRKAKFSNIVMSYSTDGLMDKNRIERILKRHGIEDTYKFYSIPYRKYISKQKQEEKCLHEYLFFIKKECENHIAYFYTADSGIANKKIVNMNKKRYMKGPMNYIGGKYKLLPQIIPYFPNHIKTFVDLFSGGCSVAINVNAEKFICNDINSKIIELFQELQKKEISEILNHIEGRISEYNLSKTNEAGFIKFREDYNKTPSPLDLYTLMCYSFNYQFRFNSNLEYNNPFGRNRSQFSRNMRQNLIAFVEKLKDIDIEFANKDFTEFSLYELDSEDFLYCDPPYYITTGTYNDGRRGFKDWKEAQEADLYKYLDKANSLGIKFALSNVIEHKGKRNDILLKWAQRYKIIDLNYNYSNASHNTRKGESREVLIINY